MGKGVGSESAESTYEEEHDRTRVVQFVHGVEIGDAVYIADIYDGEVFDTFGNLVEDFVLAHAIWVVVATEANYDEALVLGEDGLVDVPTRIEMW